jgi:hypothetical protein
MRTFAQKTPQPTSDTRRPPAAQSAAISPIQQLRHTVGHQALQRMVQAHAGKAEDDAALGANIRLEFTANELVESSKIGLIQSVKAMKSSKTEGVTGPDRLGARTTVATPVGQRDKGQSIMEAPVTPDRGREIDVEVHPHGRPTPSTSPIYALGHDDYAGGMETALNQGKPNLGNSHWSQWGSYQKDATGKRLPVVPARIEDGPWRPIEFVGQTFEMSFEVAALAVEGPMPVNTYLGSVSWGWSSDTDGKVTVAPLALVQAGAPSAAFMGAATLWNIAAFHKTGTNVTAQTVDIPLTGLDSGKVAAAKLSTPDLQARIKQVDLEISLAAGVDRTNKEFEKRALEAELASRTKH